MTTLINFIPLSHEIEAFMLAQRKDDDTGSTYYTEQFIHSFCERHQCAEFPWTSLPDTMRIMLIPPMLRRAYSRVQKE